MVLEHYILWFFMVLEENLQKILTEYIYIYIIVCGKFCPFVGGSF